MTRAWLCILFVLLMGAPGLAIAQVTTKQLDAARALANAGFELFKKGDFVTAYERFAGAEKIYHAPPHVLYMARCKAKSGALLAARDIYDRLATESLSPTAPSEFFNSQTAARAELAGLAKRIPTVTFTVSGPLATAVTLTIDGAATTWGAGRPLELDPGAHEIAATAPGYAPLELPLTLGDGAAEVVTLTFDPLHGTPEPTPEEEGDSLFGPIALLTIGGLGLVAGGVTGGLALDNASALKEACPDRTNCPPDNEDLENRARNFGTASTISFVVGGVAFAGGLTWLLVALGSEDEAPAAGSIAPFAEGCQAGVRVRF